MTQIVGNVLDVGLDGANGTITVWAGFRPEATALIAPRRKTYDIVGGVIPDGVEVAPGPVHIEIDMGLNAYDSISVTVPDQATVTIQDLYLQGYVWEPYVITQVAEDRERAEAAANRAEAAADDVDAAITDAASQVIADVEADRVAAEAARSGAEDARDAAAGSASDAAASASAAGDQATLAGQHADDAGAARDAAAGSASAAAGSASDAASSASDAAGSAAAAASSASDAAGSASAAAGHASAAEADADRAQQYAEAFDLTTTTTTGAPGTPAQVTVTGDGPAYGLSFTVPQGEQGEQGPPGEVSQAMLDAAVASLVDGAPEALDTLQELADALGNDPNFATTVSTEIGKRALIDGAPEAYNTLGKLVAALQNHELGGSTDASLLTGALTDQVDASAAMATVDLSSIGGPASMPGDMSTWLTSLYVAISHATDGLSTKADADHTHTADDIGAEPAAWTGTQAQYDALGSYDPNVTYYVIEE